MVKKLFMIPFFLGIQVFSIAQLPENYFDIANLFYKRGEYFSAATYYEKYLFPESNNKQIGFFPYTSNATKKKKNEVVDQPYVIALIRAADSYRQLNYYSKSAPLYKEAIKSVLPEFPLVKYHYAMVLKALGDLEGSRKMFEAFAKEYRKRDATWQSVSRELENLEFVEVADGIKAEDEIVIPKAK